MKRITREQFVTELDPRNKPNAHIKSGETIVAETWDAFMGAWGVGETPEHSLAAAGPIHVEGAKPGDVLKVELLRIDPVSLKPGKGGLHNVSKGKGFLGDEFTRHHPIAMAIEGGNLIFPGGIKIPLNPSLGFIATTYSEPRSTSTDSGPYGGDIDMKELTAGTTIWLPVFVEGGMLCLGDIHGVLGDGAVGGTGAECAGEVEMRISIDRDVRIGRPRVLTPDHLITVCYGEDVGDAMRQAVRDMVDFLVDERGMDPYEAYSLASLAGDVRISRTFRPISPVKMMLQRGVLDQVRAAKPATAAH
jgi:amidase